MPQEIVTHKTILDAIERVEIISHCSNEITATRTRSRPRSDRLRAHYNGKKVVPYGRLLVYEAAKGHPSWRAGRQPFFISVDGTLDVYVQDQSGKDTKGRRLHPGTSFGEMSILPACHATRQSPSPRNSKTTVLESAARPALLRKLAEVRAEA